MSKEKVKSNNKLKIAVIVLAIALVAAIGGIFGVYAATQQNVNTAFSVQYSIGKNVAVAIGARTGNTSTGMGNFIWFEADTNIEKNDETNLYEIGVNDNDQNLNLHLPEEYNGVLSITNSSQGQALSFYFQNLSSTDINVTVQDNCTVVGDLDVYYYYDILPTSTPLDYIFAGTETDLSSPITIKAGELCELFIMVYFPEDADVNKSASYTSDANGGLSFRFEQA